MSVEGTGMANSEDITRFTAVDHTQEPDFFRRFLDEGNKIPDIVSSRCRSTITTRHRSSSTA
jgi:hypothetical protein